jgi:hypothetical protein
MRTEVLVENNLKKEEFILTQFERVLSKVGRTHYFGPSVTQNIMARGA